MRRNIFVGTARVPGRPYARRWSLRVAALSAGGAVALGAGVLTAGPAMASPQPSCGDVLTASVTLTANLDCSSYTAGPALTINSNNITLNLGGYTITGPGGSSDTDGVQIGANGHAPGSDTVTNGIIENFEIDVDVTAARNLALSKLQLLFDTADTYYGIYAYYVAVGTFSNVTAQDASYGIYLLRTRRR